MRSETFTLYARELEDGRIYVTSDELPGFRLLVEDLASVESEVAGALRAFYPLFVAAKARAEARNRQPRVSRVDRTRKGSFAMSAEFAFA